MEARRLPDEPDAIAPDGAAVRVLLSLAGGSMAHFSLAPGQTSAAVVHRTVAELWYFLHGQGEMWLCSASSEEIVPVENGVCISIPVGTRFQFRSLGEESLGAVGVTMPPWPGEHEAELVQGPWEPTR